MVERLRPVDGPHTHRCAGFLEAPLTAVSNAATLTLPHPLKADLKAFERIIMQLAELSRVVDKRIEQLADQ